MARMARSMLRSLSPGLLALTTAAFLPATASAAEYERHTGLYDCPGVTLLNQDREEISLREHVNGDKPIILEFVFTSCQTICPIMSAGLSNFQKKMGDRAGEVRLVSVSIDPQHDTPERMKAYLERYEAGPGWDFLTGTKADIDSIRIAFEAQTSDKMEHLPLTFLRAPGDEQWIRLEGLLSGSDLMKEYEELTSR